MRTFKSSVIAVAFLVTTLISHQMVSAAPTDVFPKGPYKATLIAEQILYPSLLGVTAGLPVADVSGVLLADGKLRAYVFAQNKGIEIWDSSDGISFTRAGNAFGGDKGYGMPRVIKLTDGRFRMYNLSSGGISCSISSDGLNFTLENVACIGRTAFGISGNMSSPGIVKLASGGYRAYFSTVPVVGSASVAQKSYSATSTDGLTWTPDAGIRIGTGSSIDQSAEHPTAINHSDGSVTMFYFDGITHGLYYASSKDGLTFSNPTAFDLSSLSPRFRTASGNDPDIFLDKNGDMILWAGEFSPSIGGYILSVKLTQTSAGGSSTTATTATTATTPAKTSPIASKAKSTIICVKGKTVKKVTGTNPKCPAGYKKK
jgi:hypothetical protein